MARQYKLLRERMRDYNYSSAELAEKIRRTPQYFSACMSGRSQIRLNEIHEIMEMLEIPTHEMWIYFPRNGVTVKNPEYPRELNDAEIASAFAKLMRSVV